MSSNRLGQLAGLAIGLLFFAGASAEPATKASNTGSIVNTRHNLTQSFVGAGQSWMDLSRNNYGEVCVYCHTPHGANTIVAAPLWNRTIKATTYTTYDQLGTSTITQEITQPGVASLTCLSCHDGQIAVDSIVNMPGPGRYSLGQNTNQDNSFLDSWPGGPGESFYGGHGTLSNTPAALAQFGACQSCHSINGDQYDGGVTIPTFDVFFIGTDLRNDHPIGITFPGGDDFKTGSVTKGQLRFFDANLNGHADKNEVRFYNTGQGFEVECASCHDPHGVPKSGNSGPFTATFLRVENTQSSLCLTCHEK